VLRVDDVHTYYGDSHILQGVSLRAAPGTIVGLLGRNGAGKTTLVRSAMGFLRPPVAWSR
jgi:branched-chain amino acid transport system ATP-binding protein